jgi:hypothetical protein
MAETRHGRRKKLYLLTVAKGQAVSTKGLFSGCTGYS